ncbi:flagellar biosynthesis protein FlhB [Fodinibius sediminis]|nr:flagellar biosynthesis protein FlhB [Fodinibius sediminis]
MPEQDNQNKTEEPTARKLKKAREEGNVAKSQEVASVMLMVIAMVVLLNFGDWIYGRYEQLFEFSFVDHGQSLNNQASAMEYLGQALMFGFEMISPLFAGLVVVAILAHVGQTGVVFAPKVLEVKASRLSPAKGLKKIFSMRGVVEFVKGFSKIFLIGVIIYFTLRTEIGNFTSFLVMPLKEILLQSGDYIILVTSRILAALVVLSLMDAAYTQYQHHKDLRMTKEEVKDEQKQMEGDPHMKNKRKEKAMSFVRQKRLDHAVLSSDAVVTNPTHYAVALKYEPREEDAPVIQVKGMRNRALKIRELAREYEVPVIENPPVARALHASAEEGEFVPPELYQAVAEILAYVYQLKQQDTT